MPNTIVDNRRQADKTFVTRTQQSTNRISDSILLNISSLSKMVPGRLSPSFIYCPLTILFYIQGIFLITRVRCLYRLVLQRRNMHFLYTNICSYNITTISNGFK